MTTAVQLTGLFGRVRLISVALGAMALLGAATAAAENRLALVIGNNAYVEIEPLDRAVADARAYKTMLEDQRGFQVYYGEDAGRREMNGLVAEFLAAIRPGDTAMIVYSGHGVQLDAERRDSLYLLPIDFPNRDPGRGAENHFFDSEGLNFARLAENVAARGAKLRIYVLDACRNNPFNRDNTTRAIGVSRGIGRIQSSSGEFVIYAASPGGVSFDSLPGDTTDSDNSVFTRAFIKYFRAGVYLEDVANDVQAEVVKLARAANVEQEPYYSDGVAGRTCLDEACGAATTPDEKLAAEQEELYWKYCEEKDQAIYCRAFLDQYPKSWRAGLALARLKVLEARGDDRPDGGAAGDRLAAVGGPKDPDRTVVRGGDGGDTAKTGDNTARETGAGAGAPGDGKPDGDTLPRTGDGLTVTNDKPADDKPADVEPVAKKPANRDGTAAETAAAGERTPKPADANTMDAKTDATTRNAGNGDGMKVAAVDPEKVTGASPEPIAPTRDQLRDVQVRLTVLGHRPGPIDGLMGNRTRGAIEAFQTAENMVRDGNVSQALIARLEQRVPDEALEEYYAAVAAEERARAERARDRRERVARERAINRGRRDTATGTRETVKPPAPTADKPVRAADRTPPATEKKPDNRATIPGTRVRTNIRLRDRKTTEKPFYCRSSPERQFWDDACR